MVLGLLEKHKASLPPSKSAKAKSTSTAKEKPETKNASKSLPSTAKETKTVKTGKAASKTVGKKGAVVSMKGKQVEDSGPPLVKGPTLQQRQKDERNHKVSDPSREAKITCPIPCHKSTIVLAPSGTVSIYVYMTGPKPVSTRLYT